MAIIKELPGLEVTIFTNGRVATEYDDPSALGQAQQRLVTKYIEGRDDETYNIQIKASDEYSWGDGPQFLPFKVFIDGRMAKIGCMQKYAEKKTWEENICSQVLKDPNNPSRYFIRELSFESIVDGNTEYLVFVISSC